MNKDIALIILYDDYRALLTEKQKALFEAYYFDNLSLSEISDNFHISRNAVHKTMKIIANKLIAYEAKLHLKEKREALEEIMKSLEPSIQEQILSILQK